MSTFLTTGALKEDIVEIAASSSTPLILTALSPAIIHVSGTQTQLIVLPDATTLEAGIHYVIINDSTGLVTVENFTATTVTAVGRGFSSTLYLSSKATSAGVWVKLESDSSLYNDKNLKLIGGGTWSWDLGTTTLTSTGTAYVVVAGLSSFDNSISAGSIVLASDEVAYVILNRVTGGSSLTVYTAIPSAVPTNNSDILIIAYRDGLDVIVGNASFRLIDGQSTELEQGLSVETRTLLGSGITAASFSPDWISHFSPLRTIPFNTSGIIDSVASIDSEIDKFFGQLRLYQYPATLNPDILNVTGSDRTTLRGEVLSQVLGSRALDFSGASINFTTGTILDALSNPLGLNFTPYSVPTSEYFWYCLLIEYTGTNPVGTSTARLRVALASSSNASESLAPYPQFPTLFRTRPLGLIQVFNDAGSIKVNTIRQLGVGGGSGGDGGGGGLTSVRAMDLTTAALPTGAAPFVVDGITIVNEDTVLLGNAALNRVYKVTGIGVAIAFEEMAVFSNGNVIPQIRDAILVKEGSPDNCTIWFSSPSLTPPWERVAGPASTVWTGATPYAAPIWDGALSSADTTLSLALNTIDKYFRGLQLRRHSTDPKRVTILASSTTKTDLTVLNFTIADRLMSFAGAEINFETGNIYAANGVTIIGTFTPYAIPQDDFFWYGVGFNSVTSGSDNTISPQIVIEFATGYDTTPTLAPKPSLTSRYTLGAVVVEGGTGGVGITPITQGSIIYLGQFTGLTALEATVAQNTLDILTLQAFVSSLPLQQKFEVGVGGQSVFNLTAFSVDPSNAMFDVDYLIDGRWQTQSITGDFLDGGAVRKNSSTQIETAEVVPEGKEFIVLKRTMTGGAPLVDLTGITVNLGFITPKTVGTLLRPASSLILKDKVTSDIWELEVSSGVLQAIKIN